MRRLSPCAGLVIAMGFLLPGPAAALIITDTLALTKTAGLDPGSCATTQVITTTAGADVTYCYTVENTTAVTLTTHDLVDSQIGAILDSFQDTMPPGSELWLTRSSTLTSTTVNVATWTATTTDTVAEGTDVVTVTVGQPSIVLTKTVGLDPVSCASAGAITVTAGTQVFYCYLVQNTGPFTVTQHGLVDSELGQLLGPNFPLPLGPGDSVFLTAPAVITGTLRNVATWTADEGFTSASGVDAADVNALPPGARAPLLGNVGFALAAAFLLLVGGWALSAGRRLD